MARHEQPLREGEDNHLQIIKAKLNTIVVLKIRSGEESAKFTDLSLQAAFWREYLVH